jgi:hypothetical protein
MVIGLIRAKPAAAGSLSSWHGGSNSSQISDSGSKDPVVRLSQMLGQTTLVAEQQQSLKRCLELAKAEALSAFDRVGFLESLAVCTNEERAMQKHQVSCHALFAAVAHPLGWASAHVAPHQPGHQKNGAGSWLQNPANTCLRLMSAGPLYCSLRGL